MAIKTIVNSVKFFNEFKNDPGFVSNLGSFTTNLTGEVLTNVKVEISVDISWGINYAPPGGFNWTLTKSGTLLTIVSNDGYDFINEGFAAGDVVDLGLNIGGTPVLAPTLPITFVLGNTMVIDTGVLIALPGGIIGVRIDGKNDLVALNYKFGLIENAESFNTISKVSNNDQGYYATGIGADLGGGVRDTSFVDMTRLGTYKDWQTGSARVRFVSSPALYVQRFIIEHEFMIVPFYLEGQLTNLENNVLPTLFNGLNSLKYVFNAGFRINLSNPNTEKPFQIDEFAGSVAWFNENFNGFQNDYEIKSVDYFDGNTLLDAEGILASTKTKIEILVGRDSTPFVAGDRFGVYISYLPEQNEYENTILSDLKQNFIYDRALNSEGVAATSGDDFITSCEAVLSGGDLLITLEMEYSSLQKAFLANKINLGDTKYLIGVEVGDNTLSSAGSNRVMLLADVKNYDLSADIPGLMEFTKYDIYKHNKQIGVGTPSTDAFTWNEDGLVVDYNFYLDLNKQAFLNSLDFKLIAYNPLTEQMFELDSYTFGNIASAIVSGGVQQINDITTRNYNLAAGDQFNDVSIITDSNAGGLQNYVGRFGLKISWQDWLSNADVDPIFYDLSKPNYNLNDKASNYSFLNDYEIRLAVTSNLDGVSDLGVSGNTDYLFLSPAINVYDYNKGFYDPSIWSGVIQTFHPTTLVDLGGQVLSGEDTIMKTTWTSTDGAITDLTDFWAIHRIEESNQLGYEIDELSSINPFPTPNRLIPLSGETQLKIYLDAGNVITECLVDGSQITSGVSYNLSSRIEQGTPAIPEGAKITEEDVLKDTEGDELKIIEE